MDFLIDNAHIEELFPGKKLSREKFTCPLSDPLPTWSQMKVDIDGFRFGQIVQGEKNYYDPLRKFGDFNQSTIL